MAAPPPASCLLPPAAVSLSGRVTSSGPGELDLPICVHSRWRVAPSRGAGKVQFEHSGDNEIEKLDEHLSDSQTQGSHVASGTTRGRRPIIVVATTTTTTIV